MTDIFLSYTKLDKSWAEWIGHELNDLGYEVHLHDWETSGGDDILKWMEDRHHHADHVLCVISAAYLNAPFSTLERHSAQWAAVSGKPRFLLPVLIESCEIPTLLATFKHCELYAMTEEEARTKLRDFVAAPRKPTERRPFPGVTPRKAAEVAPPFPARLAQSAPQSRTPVSIAVFGDLTSLVELVDALVDGFEFRWERGSFDETLGKPLIYWPVRLRHPTPIHAAQCFAAAALQQKGADIHLFIDDLGTADYSLEEFRRALSRWFSMVGGSNGPSSVVGFSDVLSGGPGEDKADPWPAIRKWLGETYYLMENVLRISKLMPAPGVPLTIDELGKRRPRRILTPALVWSCLLYLHSKTPNRPLVTLGGYDERLLWQAWRECSASASARVGHLYVPQLSEVDTQHGTRALHMADTKLSIEWASKDDIKRAFQDEFDREKDHNQWFKEGRLIPWCIANCVFLPRFVKGEELRLILGTEAIGPNTSLRSVDREILFQVVVAEIAKWLV